ncbi:MAG: DinB family protein [Planctomycetota bacterium]
MFDRNDALQLLEYDRWAGNRLARALEAAGGNAEGERQWAHVVASLECWFERVIGAQSGRNDFWPKGVALSELARRFEGVHRAWRAHLERLEPAKFARVVRFKNSKAEDCADPLEAILQHVVNHGTHHRAQIASALRAAGHTPPASDYIVWRRELAKETPPRESRPWKHFVIASDYLAPLTEIDKLLVEHRTHLGTGYTRGLLLASGPQNPRIGGMILARAHERAELELFLAEDPFHKAGIARYHLVEFDPVKQSDLFTSWAAPAVETAR